MMAQLTEEFEEDILETYQVVITKEYLKKYRRLDQLLTEVSEGLSRSIVKKLFLKGHITSDQKLDLKKMPKEGTKIEISIPVPQDLDVKAENIPLDIIFEDEHLILINKPAGMVVHPAPGNYTGTLVNAIIYHCPDLKGIGNVKRPGIVHRLDKGTTGIMVVAKDQKTHEGLVKLFSEHNIKREYETLVIGHKMDRTGTLESLIGRSPYNRLKMSTKIKNGKDAITHYEVLGYYKHLAHVLVTLETGRTHQIRVHFSELLGRPLLNDPLYGNQAGQKKTLPAELVKCYQNYEHPLLHARTLGFTHPITKKEILYSVDPPETFKAVLKYEQDNS